MIVPSVALQGMAGMGATPRRTRKITLDPIVIEGKGPAGSKFRIPWGWVAIAGGLGGLYLLARWAKKKAGRRAALA